MADHRDDVPLGRFLRHARRDIPQDRGQDPAHSDDLAVGADQFVLDRAKAQFDGIAVPGRGAERQKRVAQVTQRGAPVVRGHQHQKVVDARAAAWGLYVGEQGPRRGVLKDDSTAGQIRHKQGPADAVHAPEKGRHLGR